MVNFLDAFTREKSVFFTLGKSYSEVASALMEYVKRHEHRLKGGKFSSWKCDNGKEFRGDKIDGENGAARELTTNHSNSVPNKSNTNAAAERLFGVVENSMRRAMAYAGAPPCLWSWAANQVLPCRLLPGHALAQPAQVPARLRQPQARPGRPLVGARDVLQHLGLHPEALR